MAGYLKIGWLDSTGQPSHIHITNNQGFSSLCGYAPLGKHQRGDWVIYKAPNKVQGHSNRCRYCYDSLHRLKESNPKDWFIPCN